MSYYIPAHQSLLHHRKTLRVMRALKISRMEAIGHLMALWWWCLDNALDGDLSDIEDEVLAEGAWWQGDDAGRFVRALIDAGFIDETPVDGEPTARHLHHWEDYIGPLFERQRRNAEYQRRYRETRKITPPAPESDRKTDVSLTTPSGEDAVSVKRREEKRNKEKRGTTPPSPPAQGGAGGATDAKAARAEKAKQVQADKGRHFGEVYDALKALGISGLGTSPSEAAAAHQLRLRFSATDIAECWRDYQQGAVPDQDDMIRRNTSCVLLNLYGRVEKWKTWRDAGRPAAALKARSAALGRQGHGDAVYQQDAIAHGLNRDYHVPHVELSDLDLPPEEF